MAGRRRILIGLVVIAAWTLIALAWTPPTILVQQFYTHRGISFPVAFAALFLNFVPWMAATPLIFWLGRRYPVTEQSIAKPLAIHAAVGVVFVPVLTVLGLSLGTLAEPFQQNAQQTLTLARLMEPAAITAFYTIPTYIAVVAIGQALAYFERYRTRERLLARAELRALEAQLNPHFLFNTLNAISVLGYRDPALADKAITLLSTMLRTTLKERPEFVALKDEVAFLKDYLELYALLIPGRLDQIYAVEPDVWNAAVPAMLLQPLAENALVHGISRLPEGGQLMLTAACDGKRLKLSLHNPAPSTQAPSHGAGIGLANVRERLRVLFGEDARLSFERDNADAHVLLDLPFSEVQT